MNIVRLGYGIVNLFVRLFLTEDKIDDIQIPNLNIFMRYLINITGLCILITIGYVFFYIKELKDLRQIVEISNCVEYAVVSTDRDKINPSVERQTLNLIFFLEKYILQ